MYLNYKRNLNSLNSSIDVTAGYSYQKFMMDNSNLKQNYNREKTTFDNRAAYDHVLIGFFGRLNYSYSDKYLLTATLRRDATSRFSKSQRWGWFPSLALAWRVNEEDFLKNSNTVSDLKVRLSWGITGQENLGKNPYPFLPVYQTSNNQYAHYPMGDTFVPTLRPNIYDSQIKWEEQTTYNLGVDFGLFENKLYGSLDIYTKTTDDLLQKIGAPMPNLNNEITTNVGSMTNKGFEFALGVDVLNTDSLKWNLNMNASYNKNEITKISFGEGLQFYQTGNDISGGTGNKIQVNMLNKPAQSFYVYEQIYDNNGKPIEGEYVDQNGDGVINEQDLRIWHSPRPKWMLGLSSNVSYKNWDLEFSARANLDNHVYNNLKSDMGVYSALSGSKGYLSNVHADILNTNFEERQYFSDYYIENASFLKLDYLTIGYRLDFLKDINLRINGSVQNVFTITGYDGLDPEVGDGIDNYSYARPRTYSLGLNINF